MENEQWDVEDNTHKSVKVEMRSLSLSHKTKNMVIDTLKHIHGDQFSIKDHSTYKDKGGHLSNRYWLDRGSLMVKGGVNYSKQKTSIPIEINLFALNKLQKYGFHKNHCTEALTITKGDVGCAFEYLMSVYFNLKMPVSSEKILEQHILEERQNECESLKSIYENVEEKIANQLWIVHLNLPYLWSFYLGVKYTNVNETVKKKDEKNFKKKKELCRYFLRGKCTFNDRCRFSHEMPVKEPPKFSHLDDPHMNKFDLEVRFPSDCKYPYEVPFIAFSAPSEYFPAEKCLHITNILLSEANLHAQNEHPCIYELIDLLCNRQDEMLALLLKPPPAFMDCNQRLQPNIDNDDNEDDKIEKNVYNNGRLCDESVERSDTRSNVNYDLKKKFKNIKRTYNYKSFLTRRKQLPAWDKQNDILSIIRRNAVVIISGDTGCGKTTQVPQFVLDEWLNSEEEHTEIVCTQPRRISAISVAERVASERGERIGGIVGYQIRLENKVSMQTRLTYCTTGILLRRLESDPFLNNVTHVIVDEVHERSEESDFLLLILKDLMNKRRDMKIILMSATLNPKAFCSYFGQAPMVEIPGRTFPVEQYFLEDILTETNYVLEEYSFYSKKIGNRNSKDLEKIECEQVDNLLYNSVPNPKSADESLPIKQLFYRYKDYPFVVRKTIYVMDSERINLELIEETLKWIVKGPHNYPRDGSILIFLPGLSDILSLLELLNSSDIFAHRLGAFDLIPLHSTLTNEEQALVFKKPRHGARKIILATNIAETSVTIDDCVFVIDTGRMKETMFDSNKNMQSLETVWVSRANALQRKGRAGRVKAGVCIHLYTNHRFSYVLESQPVPEIQRAPLEQTILRIKMIRNLSDNIYEVFENLIEPPCQENILGAISRLQNVGALTDTCELTALGHHLASLPLDIRLGKLILFGAMLCCLDSALTIAACLSFKNPFIAPLNKKEEAGNRKRQFVNGHSDHLTVLKAYNTWRTESARSRDAGRVFARENFLSLNTLNTLGDIKADYLELLIDIGFVSKHFYVGKRRGGPDRILEMTGNEVNVHCDNQNLLAAILCTSLYPNVVKILSPEKMYSSSISGAIPIMCKPDELRFQTKSDGYVDIHPSSINFNIGFFPSPYLVYQEKVKTSRIFIRDCTMVPVMPLVLFSTTPVQVELHCGQFVISLDEGWIMFSVDSNEVAELIDAIKNEFLQLLDEKIKDPSMNIQANVKGQKIITSIVQLITNP